MLLEESILRNIIRKSLHENNFIINEDFYYNLNNNILIEISMQKLKNKAKRLSMIGLLGLCFSNLAVAKETNSVDHSPGVNKENTNDQENAYHAFMETAIIKLMITKNISRNEAIKLFNKQMKDLEELKVNTRQAVKKFNAVTGVYKGHEENVKNTNKLSDSQTKELRQSYKSQEEAEAEKNRKIKNKPFSVLNDPKIKKTDSRYVKAVYEYNSVINNYLFNISSSFEDTKSISDLNKKTQRAVDAKNLMFKGVFADKAELNSYLNNGNLPSR
tara:strand:+ start:1511 stop:2329 length:819 start_codon:yes stop_codon:yes gene_type:complete